MTISNAIRLAPNLSLPLDVVTEMVAILAKRRSGKSYTARKLVEQLMAAALQVVVVDPKSDWWGLRSSADGKRPGFPVLIAGGEHGDVPLEPNAGEVLVRFVVEQRVNLLLDLSSFRKHEVATFMTGFLEALYRLKAREEFRTPMMLVIDEADAIAPQRPQKGEERMLGAAEDIVRRGGQRGIGCMLVSQRSAVLNKNVLTQAQVLIALRTMSPQDLAALDSWIEVHGSPAERKVLFDSLPSLPIGDAWVWSPGWPTADGIFQRIHVAPIETFDSGATPKVGQKITPPKSVAEVDLGALKQSMAATIEKAKADDPRELRKVIQSLRQELAKRPTETKIETREVRVEVPVLSQEQFDGLAALANGAAKNAAALAATADQLLAASGRILEALTFGNGEKPSGVSKLAGQYSDNIPKRPVARIDPIPQQHKRPATANVPAPRPENPAKLAGAERKVLSVLAQYPHGRSKRQVALLTGYAIGGGGFNNALSSLRTKGFISGRSELHISDVGLRALGHYERLPEGRDLFNHWLNQCGRAERTILEVLADVWPGSAGKDEVAERTGYAATGGGFNNALSRLRTLELIAGSGELRLTDAFGEAVTA